MPKERIPTSLLPLRNEVLLILLTLAAEPLHGYALMQRIEEDSGGAVVMQAGALYRTLRNMLVDHLVEESDDASETGRDVKRRRVYRLTRHGREAAQREVDRLSQLVRLAGSRQLTLRPKVV